MKRIINIAVIFTLLVFCLTGCAEEEAYPKATDAFFVNDFADVIDKSDEETILASAAALNKKTTAQVVVVTVKTLNGKEAFQYATDLANEWGVGAKEADNGILILLAEEERDIFIAVGKGLEGHLPDSKTGRIIDLYGLSYLKADDFSTGLTSIAKAVINEVYINYGLEPEEGYVNIENVAYEGDEEEHISVFASWIILIVILVIIQAVFHRRGGGFFFFGGPTFFGGGPRSGGFGGGSFGGGGFSGGGGSFGGGGAGRGF